MSALFLAIAVPGFVPAPAVADDYDSGVGLEATRRHHITDPGIVVPGDDDQPTISGRKDRRGTISASAPVNTAPRQAERVPPAGGNGLPLHVFLLSFLLRLGLMLR